jgi:hypothetical protein
MNPIFPLPRLVPEMPLPSYAHVPGKTPHPNSDPRGHSYGKKPERLVRPDKWQACRPYLHGIDLFNRGFYWEAHEVWEGVWHAYGRAGAPASFVKGLIKLAAAGVKHREGSLRGVRSHTSRAAELFQQVAEEVGTPSEWYMGLCLKDLIQLTLLLASAPAAVKQMESMALPGTQDIADIMQNSARSG